MLLVLVCLLALGYGLPLAISGVCYLCKEDRLNWRSADRSSTGLLPLAAIHPQATVRIFAARTVRWRGIVSVHCWLVLKPERAADYTRYDYTAWGEPVRLNGFAADGRWFGNLPLLIFAADGAQAAALIPRMQAAIAAYPWRTEGDYRAWPGPNSNTFVAAVADAVPEARIALPPHALGKDYPYDGRWAALTAARDGVRLTLGGYLGVTVGLLDGIELNILGAVLGLDILRPAIKLPGLGRFGVCRQAGPATTADPAAPARAG